MGWGIRRILMALCAVAIGSAGATAHAQPGVFRGPYLTDVTSDAITLLWESPTPTTGTIRYGVAAVTENVAVDNVPATHHEVRLTGLSALAAGGTKFVYELEVDGMTYPGSFRTAVVGDAPFSFVVFGDNRSSVPQHMAVLDALLAEPTEAYFAMSTGDMVSDGNNESQWDSFFTIEQPFLAKTPVYLAIGNHEVDGGDWQVPRRIFAAPTTVPPASNDESFYHFVYGNAQIIVINIETHTLFPSVLGVFGGDQEVWLTDVLDNPPAGIQHRFLFIHQGPYSSKPGRDGNFWLRTWLPDLKAANIDVIISGHDHYAERGFAVNGVPYVIHGGGGAPLYDTLGPRVVADHTILYGETRLGYVVVDVDGPHAEVSIRTLDGFTIDNFSYGDPSHPAACVSASDCGGPPTYGCPDGSWECVKSFCRYTCDPGLVDSLVTCFTNTDCENAIGAVCGGQAHCEMPDINPLEWHCLCDVAPQCVSDANCAGLEPPIAGCAGSWACVDETCEFSPDTVCDPPGPTDAGVPDATAAPVDDAGSTAGDDAGGNPANPDAGGGSGSSGGCGCKASSNESPYGVLVWLLLALAALGRRRRVGAWR